MFYYSPDGRFVAFEKGYRSTGASSDSSAMGDLAVRGAGEVFAVAASAF
jgi:hypothetical protein